MKLLLVGSSEAFCFQNEREYLARHHGVELIVNGQAGRRLEECIEPVEQEMDSTIDAVWIWALTPWAWQRRFIAESGRKSISVFAPNNDYNLADVPRIMNQINEIVDAHNPQCRVYLCIPACKDVYKFNQKRLARNWKENSIHVLANHPDMNRRKMREHSITTFHKFEMLTSTLPEYRWNKKYCLKSHDAIKYFHQHDRNPPYMDYFQRKSYALNIPILPDGLHGSAEFIHAYCKTFSWVFQVPRRMRARAERVSLSTINRLTYTEPTRGSSLDQRTNPVDNDYLSDIQDSSTFESTTRPRVLRSLTSSTWERNQSTTSIPSSNVDRHPHNIWTRLSPSSSSITFSERDLSFYQSVPPPTTSSNFASDDVLSTRSIEISNPVTPTSVGNDDHNIVDGPPDEEIEVLMRDFYEKLVPMGTPVDTKKEILDKVYEITQRELRMLSFR